LLDRKEGARMVRNETRGNSLKTNNPAKCVIRGNE
jgi:hypothetical protein